MHIPNALVKSLDANENENIYVLHADGSENTDCIAINRNGATSCFKYILQDGDYVVKIKENDTFSFDTTVKLVSLVPVRHRNTSYRLNLIDVTPPDVIRKAIIGRHPLLETLTVNALVCRKLVEHPIFGKMVLTDYHHRARNNASNHTLNASVSFSYNEVKENEHRPLQSVVLECGLLENDIRVKRFLSVQDDYTPLEGSSFYVVRPMDRPAHFKFIASTEVLTQLKALMEKIITKDLKLTISTGKVSNAMVIDPEVSPMAKKLIAGVKK